MMQALYQTNPKLFTEGTFIEEFRGLDNQAYKLGESLEIGFARLVRTVAAKVTSQTYGSTKDVVKSKVGGLHTQVPDLNKEGAEIMKEVFSKCYYEAGKALKEYNKDKEPVGEMTTMRSVQGKIDNIGLTSEFVASVNVSGMDRDILMALKEATFTAKNYLSTTELKFGQTNPFRVFATVSPLGEDTTNRYYRMLNCFREHDSTHSSAPTTFYRLRAIYELTGARMKYTESTLVKNPAIKDLLSGKIAKFLIWNTPWGDIHVIPTRQIVNKVIDGATMAMPDNWRDALYGPIKIPQDALLGLYET